MSRTGRDPASWLLALAVWLLPAGRGEWGRAMAADLAHVERRADRWRFAIGCLRVALWQGPVVRVAGALAVEGAAVVLALVSGITGALRVEVIGLVLVVPPALSRIGRGRGVFGQPGAGRSARLGRRVGYGPVTGCVVVAVGFIATDISHRPGGVSAAPFWLTVLVVVLIAYIGAVLAATSAASGVTDSAMTLGACFGAGAGLAGFALLPFNQSLSVHGPWLAAAYPAALAVAVVGSPTAAAMLAARRSRDIDQGIHAGACAGTVGALVVFILGVGAAWLRPGRVDASLIDKGAAWLPPDPVGVAGSYLVALVLVPLLGLVFGALGAWIGAPSRPAPDTGRRSLPPLNRALAGVPLAMAGLLCYPLSHGFDGRPTASFGSVSATSVAFSADRRALVTGANGGFATILWDLVDPARPTRSATFNGAAVFAPDGHTLATRNLLWTLADPAHPSRIAVFTGGDPVSFSSDGRTFATDDNGTAMLWDVSDGTHPMRLATFGAGGLGGILPRWSHLRQQRDQRSGHDNPLVAGQPHPAHPDRHRQRRRWRGVFTRRSGVGDPRRRRHGHPVEPGRSRPPPSHRHPDLRSATVW